MAEAPQDDDAQRVMPLEDFYTGYRKSPAINHPSLGAVHVRADAYATCRPWSRG